VGKTGIRIADLLGVTLLAVSSLTLAQDVSQRPQVPTADGTPGTRLIVWTETQRPHPIPETSTEMYTVSDQARALSGTILSRGSDLFFAVANRPAFRIENNDKQQIRALAGKQVRVYGKVDSDTNVVYVLSIAQL
jgi:hypothetical protein